MIGTVNCSTRYTKVVLAKQIYLTFYKQLVKNNLANNYDENDKKTKVNILLLSLKLLREQLCY